MVRLQRSITRTPMARAAVTSRRKCGLSSGAPPVMSSVRDAPAFAGRRAPCRRPRRHFLGAVRAGIDVAMHAGLVAAIADIDLQRVEPAAPERRKLDRFEQRPSIAHRNLGRRSGQARRKLAHGAWPRHPARRALRGQFRVTRLSVRVGYFAGRGRRDARCRRRCRCGRSPAASPPGGADRARRPGRGS